MAALDFPDPSASPWTGSNGVVYKYIGTAPNGYWTGHNVDETSDQLDARYVQKSGDNVDGPGDLTIGADPAAPVIELRQTGTADFASLTTHVGGVKVTGGTSESVSNGISGASNFVKITANNGEGNIILESSRVGSPTIAVGTKLNIQDTITTGQPYLIGIKSDIQAAEENKNIYNMLSEITTDVSTPQNWTGFLTRVRAGTSPAVNTACYGFKFESRAFTSAPEIYGFHSGVNTSHGTNTYNFYGAGIAPNFFNSDTYIGGSTSRNTFDLWKSTLTEEQLEQYEAGTLVAPANVSVPGDGEFARQWWYDQQSAEDQALIDSGELEYPTHLAATTFTDTFVLGDNTSIDLNASHGVVHMKGLAFDKGSTSINQISYNGFYYSNFYKSPLLAADNTDGDANLTGLRVVNYLYDRENDLNTNVTNSKCISIAPPAISVGSNANGSYTNHLFS